MLRRFRMPYVRPALHRLVLLALPALLLAATGAARAQTPPPVPGVLNVFGWPGFIDQRILDRFSKEAGVPVQYDTYTNLPFLEATMALGRTGYDIIMPTNEPTFSRLVEEGQLAVIDRARVPNWDSLDPALMRWVEPADPGNRHGAIYLWGTFGLGVTPDRLPADAPRDSLDLILEPRHAARMADCGITMLDSPTVVVPAVLRYLGLPPDSEDPSDLAAVERTLMAIRPYISAFSISSAMEVLATGESCLAMAYSGNVMQAAKLAETAGEGHGVAFIQPAEGAQVTFDMLAIPVDAPDKEAAHAFIDFMLRPEIIAEATNLTRYANAVPASRPMVDPDLSEDPAIYPPPERMATFFTPSSLDPANKMSRNRMWARFKSGS